VLDEAAERRRARFRASDAADALVLELATAAGPVLLAKPQTFMNRSGRVAAALARQTGLGPASLLVVHDDADLALGSLRLRWGGSPGGHNGVRSIVDTLGSREFPRLKLGVRGEGRAEEDLAEYVLQPFAGDEREHAANLVTLGADALEAVLDDGLAAAMQRYSGRTVMPA
jgi:PTH1 family peptidyl-tRNA hydrolase